MGDYGVLKRHGINPPASSNSNGEDENVCYAVKKSARVSDKNNVFADGDTWMECFAVVESQRREEGMIVRPYFESRSTGIRAWDEPPSGASNIEYATPQVREMAQIQAKDFPSSEMPTSTEKNKNNLKSKTIGKIKEMGKAVSHLTRGKSVSHLTRDKRKTLKTKHDDADVDNDDVKGQGILQRAHLDKNLQMAIALSLNPHAASHGQGKKKIYSAHGSSSQEDAFQIAIALSISEKEARERAANKDDEQQERFQWEKVKEKQLDNMVYAQGSGTVLEFCGDKKEMSAFACASSQNHLLKEDLDFSRKQLVPN